MSRQAMSVSADPPTTTEGAARPLGRRAALEHALAVLAPVATLVLLATYVARHEFAVDFHYTFWPAGLRILHGLDPYEASHRQIVGGIAFVYPPLAGFLFAPFALIARGASGALFTFVSIAAIPLSLRLVGVRDWRVYAISFLWFPVINAWQSANLTLLLGLLVALVWRYRETPVLGGLVAAAAISLKPFMWPIVLWLLATRRYRAAVWAIAGTAAVNLAGFAALGFHDISRFLHVSSQVTSALQRTGYGVIALAMRAGASSTLAFGIMILLAAAIAMGCLRVGRRGRDREALAITVTLMLAASPLVWNHYFALLIVGLGVCRPRLGPEWLLGLLLWVCPSLHVAEWQGLTAAAVSAAITLRALNERRPGAADLLARPERGERVSQPHPAG